MKSLLAAICCAAFLLGSAALGGPAIASVPSGGSGGPAPAEVAAPPAGIEVASMLSEFLNGARDYHGHHRGRRHHDRPPRRHQPHYRRWHHRGDGRPPVAHGQFHGR